MKLAAALASLSVLASALGSGVEVTDLSSASLHLYVIFAPCCWPFEVYTAVFDESAHVLSVTPPASSLDSFPQRAQVYIFESFQVFPLCPSEHLHLLDDLRAPQREEETEQVKMENRERQ